MPEPKPEKPKTTRWLVRRDCVVSTTTQPIKFALNQELTDPAMADLAKRSGIPLIALD